MISLFLFVFVCSFLGGQIVIHDFGNKKILDYDFFYEQPKNQWLELSEEKKQQSFDVFLKKELALYDAELLGLDFVPRVLFSLEERKKQLSVNFFYERFVALPLVEEAYIQTTTKNLGRELFVYHVLLGYKGCALEGSFPEKDAVLDSALLLSNKIKESFTKNPSTSAKTLLFQEEASASSQDPSVVNNLGALGWVSWGRSVDEFQVPLFLLKEGDVSPPILTPYGYHLVYVEKERPSNFSFYSPAVFTDFPNKACLQSLDFNVLREASTKHDSLLLSLKGFKVNDTFVDVLLEDLFNYLTQENIRGGKKPYLSFLEEKKNSSVLFVFAGRGFGVGWLIDRLSNTPSTRVPPLSTKEGFVSFLTNLVLQEEVFSLSQKKEVLNFPLVRVEFLKHKKNIIYNEYIKLLNEKLIPLDSSFVKQKYAEGLLDSLYFSPDKALVYDLSFSSSSLADSVYQKISGGVAFESFLGFYSKNDKQKTITRGTKGFLGEAVFSLKLNEVSSVIENTDKTFSIVKVLAFIPRAEVGLFSVYSQIEKNILKNQKKEIKESLLGVLKKRFSVSFNIKDLF